MSHDRPKTYLYVDAFGDIRETDDADTANQHWHRRIIDPDPAPGLELHPPTRVRPLPFRSAELEDLLVPLVSSTLIGFVVGVLVTLVAITGRINP